jgi:hypothetical protein
MRPEFSCSNNSNRFQFNLVSHSCGGGLLGEQTLRVRKGQCPIWKWTVLGVTKLFEEKAYAEVSMRGGSIIIGTAWLVGQQWPSATTGAASTSAVSAVPRWWPALRIRLIIQGLVQAACLDAGRADDWIVLDLQWAGRQP